MRQRLLYSSFVMGVFALSMPGFGEEEKVRVFDKGEEDDFKKGVVYKETKAKVKKKDNKLEKAVSYHIKNLKDSDADVRQNAAEMLGILKSPLAVDPLIEVLNPQRNERIMTQLAAHGALVNITGKNFGYKSYDEWLSWWTKNKEDFLKKAETGVDETSKLASVTANTVGLELMKRGEHRSAQAQFLSALDRDPTVPDYRNNLGLSLMEQGRLMEAMVYFEETIGMNPDLPQPYMNIGHCYSRMKKTIEAQTWYRKAMAVDKEGKLWEPFWLLGKEHMQKAEWQMAYEYLDQAWKKMQKRNVQDPRLYNDLAITHFGLDQYNSAWARLMDVQALGYDPSPGFLAKVRKALKDQGIDPEAEDQKARDEAKAAAAKAAEEEGEVAPTPTLTSK